MSEHINVLLKRCVSWWDAYWWSSSLSFSYRLFGVVHGFALGAFLAAWWCHAPEWLTSTGFHFPDEAVSPVPRALLPALAGLQFGALALFIVGWKPWVSAGLTWLCLLYVTEINRSASYSINSIFLFTFAVLALFPCPKSRPNMKAAPIHLLQLAMVTIYFSSGWHKIVFGDWLSSPYVLETSLKGVAMTEIASWFLRTFPAFFWTLGQAFVLMFELFSPVLFLSRKLWPIAIACGCLFHLSIALFMDQYIYFSLQMMSFYILFIPFHCYRDLALSATARRTPYRRPSCTG